MSTYSLPGYPGLTIDATSYKAVLFNAMQHYTRVLRVDHTVEQLQAELKPFADRAVGLIEGEHAELDEAKERVFYLFLKHVIEGL
jgi:hypothetical protein